ncbi:MAG TPA: lytic transglycosylase domain-containing protein [Blastocatellia bacterium]|nr:lytic transglycosylase domain-containing protein [Blastocatellia bacterium]
MKRILECLFLVLLCCISVHSQEAGVIERARVYEPYIREAAAKHGVDPRLLWTIAYLESRFRPDSVSPRGAKGMMQFIPSTAERFNLKNPYEPAQAIDAAARYVKELSRKFDGHLDLILAAYNAGEQTVIAFREGYPLILSNGRIINPAGRKTGGVPPYSETMEYVAKGITLFKRLIYLGASNEKAEKQPDDEHSDLPSIEQLRQISNYLTEAPLNSSSSIQPKTSSSRTTRSIYIQ